MLSRNLGKKEPTPGTAHNDQPMFANLDLFGMNGHGRRHKRNFNQELPQFLRLQWRKPWIPEGCSGGTPPDAFPECLLGFYDADTSAQASADVQGDKHSAPLQENSVLRDVSRKLCAGDSFDDGVARPLQKS